MIAENLIQCAPQVYAPIETQAKAAFDTAQAAADPNKLLAVAQLIPIPRSRPMRFSKPPMRTRPSAIRGRPCRFCDSFISSIRLAESRDRDRIAGANYLATPNHLDVAIARLEQGAKLPGNPTLTRPLLLPDGTTIKDVSFVDALAALRKFNEQATVHALPDFGLPAPANLDSNRAFEHPLEPVATHIGQIVAPLREFTRNDRLVTFTPGMGLSVWQGGAHDPLYTSRALVDRPVNGAWVGETLIAWSVSKMVMLKPDGSGPLWESELRGSP